MFTLWWWLKTPRGQDFAVGIGERIVAVFSRRRAKGS